MSETIRHRRRARTWSLYHSGEMLRIIQPRLDRSRGIQAITEEMLNATLADVIRRKPPQALSLAIMDAHRRHKLPG